MKDFSQFEQVGKTTNTDVYVVPGDPDLLIIVPPEGAKDTAQMAHENVDFLHDYARTLGQPCGSVVIMTNLLSQEAEARRAYGEIDPKLYYAAALVVESALSRALGSFFVGLSRPAVPTKLVDTVEKGIDWLKTMRPGSPGQGAQS